MFVISADTHARSCAFPVFVSGFLGVGIISTLSAAEPAFSGDTSIFLPATDSATAVENDAAPRFNVRVYEVKSNTSLPTNTLAGICSRYTGPNVSLDEIVKAASAVQSEYRKQGYPTMSIAIAPRQITNGTVTLNVFPMASPWILVAGERYVSSGKRPEVRVKPPAAGPASSSPAPAANAVTNAIAPAISISQKPASPEEIAAGRTALIQKITELRVQDNDTRVHVVATNAGPRFDVEKYLVMGNTVLPPEVMAQVITNVDGAFGTNTSFEGIRAAMVELQKAYRERGFATVSIGLPQQKLTNATVKVKVTEGRLAAINVTGNRCYSSNNVIRSLPSLHTNLLLNSQILQRELDNANASRDRQIYPVIGPGPEPDTSELTLKVKDQLPLHARLELNNQATPGTPNLRANLNAQYDNLWDLEHQIGHPIQLFARTTKRPWITTLDTPFDDPLIANYSGYYRLPLGGYNSVEGQVEASPGSFGYNEATHKFNLPPATGRPELNIYASRSTSDTGVQYGALSNVLTSPLMTIDSQNTGDNVTLNEGAGARLSLPLPQLAAVSSTLSFGLDYKRNQLVSYNTNNFYSIQYRTNSEGQPVVIKTNTPNGQPTRYNTLVYFPFNVGLNGSVPDTLGTTFFNSQVNFNVASGFSNDKDFGNNAYTTNAKASYVTLQMGADRAQTIYKDWSVKLHADGQWANGALISNEQYAMGGTAGVRGYQDGQAYGDTGWRFSIEPQTPLVKIGMFGNEGHEEPCWVRGSVFVDYGRIYLLESPPPGGGSRESFCGAGWAVTANLGSHLDGRVTVAWPLIDHAGESDGVHVYFGIGAQF